MKRTPLHDYLDQLEATAKTAAEHPIPWVIGANAAEQYVIATRPEVVLALIAKLREAIAHVEAYRAGTQTHWKGDEYRRLLEIEVPA